MDTDNTKCSLGVDSVGKIHNLCRGNSRSLGKSRSLWGNQRPAQLGKRYLSTIHSPYYYNHSYQEKAWG